MCGSKSDVTQMPSVAFAVPSTEAAPCMQHDKLRSACVPARFRSGSLQAPRIRINAAFAAAAMAGMRPPVGPCRVHVRDARAGRAAAAGETAPVPQHAAPAGSCMSFEGCSKVAHMLQPGCGLRHTHMCAGCLRSAHTGFTGQGSSTRWHQQPKGPTAFHPWLPQVACPVIC